MAIQTPLQREGVFKVAVPIVIIGVGALLGVQLYGHVQQRRFKRALSENASRVAVAMVNGSTRVLQHSPIQLIRESAHEGIPYELIPGFDGLGCYGEIIQTNTQGFRTNRLVTHAADFAPTAFDYAKGPLAGGVTIALLGDSIAFGEGVSNGENYAARLVSQLAKQVPRVRFRVINSGVSGYNTAVEVATLRSKLMKFAPDIVLVGFCGNDANLPNFVKIPRDWQVRAADLIEGAGRLIPAPVAADGGLPDYAPPWYEKMRGWASVRRGLKELAEIAGSRSIPVEVLLDCTAYVPNTDDASVYLGDANKKVIAFAKAHGFGTIDAFPKIVAHMRAHGNREQAYWVNVRANDSHPNALKHALMAEAILETLESRPYFAAMVRGKSNAR